MMCPSGKIWKSRGVGSELYDVADLIEGAQGILNLELQERHINVNMRQDFLLDPKSAAKPGRDCPIRAWQTTC